MTQIIPSLTVSMTSAKCTVALPLVYGCGSVSYTHLDVYKRQELMCSDRHYDDMMDDISRGIGNTKRI